MRNLDQFVSHTSFTGTPGIESTCVSIVCSCNTYSGNIWSSLTICLACIFVIYLFIAYPSSSSEAMVMFVVVVVVSDKLSSLGSFGYGNAHKRRC